MYGMVVPHSGGLLACCVGDHCCCLRYERLRPSRPRRSVYVRVRRNDLDPFLATFDAPAPHTTRGRRDVTNVPAQALTLANDPFVIETAGAFVADVRGELGDGTGERSGTTYSS